MKNKYTDPKIEVEVVEDVITTSNNLPVIPGTDRPQKPNTANPDFE